MRLHALAFIVVSTLGASTMRGQAVGDRPSVDIASIRMIPIEEYAPSLAVSTPSGELRRLGLFNRARLIRALAVSDSTMQLVRQMQQHQPVACPMPVATRDSASVPRMPVGMLESRAKVVGTIAGCVNTLQPER